jgi:hypothetical protein
MNSTDNLSNLLQSWQPEVADSRDFNRAVWMRLESEENRKGVTAAAIFSWIQLFARPRIAITAASIALFCGIFLGTLEARSTGEDRYLQSLNPYTLHRQDH